MRAKIKEEIERQVQEQLAEAERKNLIIAGLGLAGVGVALLFEKKKVTSETEEKINDTFEKCDKAFEEVAKEIDDIKDSQDAFSEIFTDIMKSQASMLNKMSSVLDKLNFVASDEMDPVEPETEIAEENEQQKGEK